MSGAGVADRLRAAGERVTGQRVAVAEALASARRPQSAEQLWHRLRVRHPALGRATVFRTLETLVAAGVARRFETESHASTYVACDAVHHHHLVCLACGAVTEIGETYISSLVGRVARDTGFELDDARVDFYGRCARCATAAG